MQRRTWRSVRKPALLATVGFVVFGSMAGFFGHQYVKGRGETMATGRETEAAELTVVPPPIDASRPKTFETATFALG
jgi:hypothetical protein